MKQGIEASHNISKKTDHKMDAAESKLLKKFKEVKQLRDNHNDELHTIKTVIKNTNSEKMSSKVKDKKPFIILRIKLLICKILSEQKSEAGKLKEETNSFEKEIKKLKRKS